MNPSYPYHPYLGFGTAFLFPADIRAIQSTYGVGAGSVQPLTPSAEPATYLLVAAGLLAQAFPRWRAIPVLTVPALLPRSGRRFHRKRHRPPSAGVTFTRSNYR